MAKKKIDNTANEFNLTEGFLANTGIAVSPKGVDKQSSSQHSTADPSWTHFTVICSDELVDKVKAVAQKEGFTIREVVEKFFRNGIGSYESKHGQIEVRSRTRQNIDDVL